jgi:excisionase family DNA binding protein
VGRADLRADPAPEVLTLAPAAERLQIAPEVVAELAGSGELPGRRIGDEWRFSRVAVLACLAG